MSFPDANRNFWNQKRYHEADAEYFEGAQRIFEKVFWSRCRFENLWRLFPKQNFKRRPRAPQVVKIHKEAYGKAIEVLFEIIWCPA